MTTAQHSRTRPAPTADLAAGTAAPPPAQPTPAARTLTLGSRTYPVTLPNVRDSRLHVAAVVITIHVLGQVALGFHVSVPQILAAILTCAVIEVALTFHRQRAIVWPASAMLTGSGVALILRVPSTPQGDHWTLHAWYVFAAVAGISLLTKYVIRYRGSHLFNPSNLGLVGAFLVLGSTRAEPLDFWWAPLDGPMILAYAVILIGGVLITRRLHLLEAAAVFWGALAVGVGLVAASGHCMVARWAFAPVCGADFWRVIVTSPEVFIFVFFMLTDPKTVPAGRVGRIAFSLALAVVATLLIAPQTTEFGTKVALLGSLVIMCAARPLLERFVPAAGSEDDHPLRFARRLVAKGAVPALARSGALLAAVALVAGATLVAGSPARGFVDARAEDVFGRLPADIDPSTLPPITVSRDVVDWNHEITGAGAQQIVLALAENLEVEHDALQHDDAAKLTAVAHGDRLDDLRRRIARAKTTGTRVAERYAIDDVHITLLIPFGKQTGLSLGLESHGTVTTERYDRDGHVVSRSSAPFAKSFVMSRPTGGRWLNVALLPLKSSS
jgi:Na+-translocating ferredoxin:NAD+ oxidoreductase RnfD subunit